MSTRTNRHLIRWLATAGLIATPGIAAAQGTPAAPSPDVANAPVRDTGEIVVTAQRRSESAQKVPIAITAVGPQQVQQLNLRTIENIQSVTPNLTFNTGYGFAQLFIRGVGSNFTTAGLENAVATYVDGAYLERASGVIFDLLDVGSVQVLKGPQGTLYGRNATGGAILINTADPTDKFKIQGTAEYGRFNHVLTDLVVNVPLTDTLSARFAGRYKRDGAYVYNVATDSKIGKTRSWDVRGKLKWQPADDLTAVLTVEHSNVRTPILPEHQVLDAPYCLACAVVPGARGGSSLGYFQTDLDFIGQPTVKATSANLRIKYNSGMVNVESVTNYRNQKEVARSDQDYSRGDFFAYTAPTGGKTYSQDLTVSTQSGSWWDILMGASYLYDDGYYSLIADGAAFRTVIPGILPTAFNGVKTTSVSAFAELSVSPIRRLKLTAGGRYTYDHKKLDGRTNVAGNLVFAGGSGVLNFGADSSFRSFTPRFVIAYDADILNLYASYSEGFKAGGFTAPAFTTLDPVLPENIKNYEVGAKFVSPDRKLRVNLAAFYYRYSNIQVTIVDVVRSGGGVIRNAAAARGKGVELDSSFQATPWLQIFGGGSYLRARYRKFENASLAGPVDAAGNPVPVGSPNAVGLGSVVEDLSGFPLNRAPKWTGFAGFTMRLPVWNDWRADLSGVVRYSAKFDHVPGAGGPLRLDREPAYTVANLSGSIGPGDDHYRLGFYVDNLFNERYSLGRQTSAPFGAYTAPARPRTYGVRASFSY
ncbi:TonB-dependent receptor [Flavisphingomonas formosensis]|uniref:TonB-dependent receptor n=1 Tax=Flavisphingomonas formosensis TaxID=861534 RepID=UPI0012FC4290|nr:TonB-dependent receptor [Sphingomonas formosensis]